MHVRGFLKLSSPNTLYLLPGPDIHDTLSFPRCKHEKWDSSVVCGCAKQNSIINGVVCRSLGTHWRPAYRLALGLPYVRVSLGMSCFWASVEASGWVFKKLTLCPVFAKSINMPLFYAYEVTSKVRFRWQFCLFCTNADC